MPKFISLRDVTFFKGIARELVDDVVQDAVVLFKVNLNETKVNIYGESVNKTWFPGVQLYALINKEPETAEYDGFGANTNQNVEFRFDRWMCEEKNTYPEIGDVIYFNNAYYEIMTLYKKDVDNWFANVPAAINNFNILVVKK